MVWSIVQPADAIERAVSSSRKCGGGILGSVPHCDRRRPSEGDAPVTLAPTSVSFASPSRSTAVTISVGTAPVTDMNGNAATLPVGVNAAASGSPLDNLTFNGNPQRTGWYQNETTLTTANVRPATFGQVALLTAPGPPPDW